MQIAAAPVTPTSGATTKRAQPEIAAHEDDEGYRTSASGSENSPQSSNGSTTDSPPPKTASRKSAVLAAQRPLVRNGANLASNPGPRFTGSAQTLAPGGPGPGGVPGDPENANNLMWLLDFKLDFFNEGETGAVSKGEIGL